MSLDSRIKGLWLFNNSLSDDAQNNDLVLSSGSPSYTSFLKYDISSDSQTTMPALSMPSNAYFASAGSGLIDLGIKFIISFWWYSPAPVGYVRHPVFKNLVSRITPIVGIGESAVDSETGLQTITQGEIVIYEVAASTTHNAIRVQLCTDDTHPTVQFDSIPYSPGLHHVFIYFLSNSGDTYSSQTASLIKILIDGKNDITHAVPGYTTITNTNSHLYINYLYHGLVFRKYTQSGSYISELTIGAYSSVIYGSDEDARLAEKIYIFGHSYITDTTLSGIDHFSFGISYDQPSTVTTNQIYTRGGNIYVARSNGDILKGYRPIWDNEFNYTTEDEVSNLNAYNKSGVTKLASGIKVAGTTIKV